MGHSLKPCNQVRASVKIEAPLCMGADNPIPGSLVPGHGTGPGAVDVGPAPDCLDSTGRWVCLPPRRVGGLRVVGCCLSTRAPSVSLTVIRKNAP